MRFHQNAATLVASLLLTTGPSSSLAKTIFTGDRIDGDDVITKLDISDVPTNSITRYRFRAAEAQGPFYYDLPIFVARGSADSLHTGRKLSLSSTVHGDELSGIRVVQRVFADLKSEVEGGKFNGTVIGLPVVNPNGVMHNQRNFYSSSENGMLTNLNRVFPGEDPEDDAALPEGYAWAVWNELWGNTTNVDIAVDMHTLTIASDGPMWAYADYRLPGVQRLAELTEADIIKVDPGEPGSIETTWVEHKIPAITLELGGPKVWKPEYIQRGYDFVFRLMDDLAMLPGTYSGGGGHITPDLSKTYVGNNRVDVACTRAGFAEYLVGYLDDVKKGQEVVRIYNTFGDVIERVMSPETAKVLEIRTDPAVEQGSVVIVLVNRSPDGLPIGGA
jgi:predicted deacylase